MRNIKPNRKTFFTILLIIAMFVSIISMSMIGHLLYILLYYFGHIFYKFDRSRFMNRARMILVDFFMLMNVVLLFDKLSMPTWITDTMFFVMLLSIGYQYKVFRLLSSKHFNPQDYRKSMLMISFTLLVPMHYISNYMDPINSGYYDLEILIDTFTGVTNAIWIVLLVDTYMNIAKMKGEVNVEKEEIKLRTRRSKRRVAKKPSK